VFWYISIAYKLVFLLFGVFLTFKTRKFPPVFNDSKAIGATVRIQLNLPNFSTTTSNLGYLDLHYHTDAIFIGSNCDCLARLPRRHLCIKEYWCYAAVHFRYIYSVCTDLTTSDQRQRAQEIPVEPRAETRQCPNWTTKCHRWKLPKIYCDGVKLLGMP